MSGYDDPSGMAEAPSGDQPIDPEHPAAQALVILPFLSKEQAEQFAVLVMHNFGADFAVPFVTSGTAYEYVDSESGETGQVFELFPDARWEAFIKDGDEAHHVIRRIIKEAVDEERTG